jgi:hypothetical protein
MEPDQRVKTLYKKGTESLMNRKDREKTDIEMERYKEECTFKPIINEK